MRKIIQFVFLCFSTVLFAQQQTVTYSINPAVFEETQSITITINGSSINETTWGVTNNALYLWAWSFDINDTNILDCPTNGTWDNSSETNRLTYNSGNDTYTMTITPTTFYNRTNIGRIGFLVKAKNGNGDKKSQDILSEVGAFQMSLLSPTENSLTIINSGTNVSIVAQNTGGNATYAVTANGTPITCSTAATSFFTCGDTNVTSTKVYQVSATIGTTTISKRFTVIVNPGTISSALPSGMEDGINYNASDATTATLVLNAPFKDFVYVAGSFNNWQPTTAYAMRKDPTTGKFWLTLTGLTPGQVYTYQYWVCDVTSRPANSPAVVKTADPFSTLVLSPFDDPEIQSLGVFPNLPQYPTGQEREVTVLQTGANTLFSYNWSSASANFQKPQKKDLNIYEVLIRDFDANRTYQDLINRIDYFKNLKVNAIQLMPVMEFEGNMSWGYNTAYHMALDKRYGPPTKLKEFIDLCHQNGIAVILDLALNHVFGRSPLVRMWMQDADNDGWADAVATTTENPYVNQYATHSYSVGSDLNHFREPDNLTNTYAVRTIRHWIQEYKIDGFRWDLTKGFTNQCTSGDDTCTNGYRSDRVAKLKWYADKQWEIDPNFLVIFEHLGTGGSYTEEVEWANYNRNGNTGGIMQWRKMTDSYAELLKGNFSDITGVAESTNRFIGYAESHDEERVGYKALNEAGQTQGNLAKVHTRMAAMGSVLFLVPGPKMIWHFGELGMTNSLWTCNAGNVSYSNPDCKLDTKPQPQWTNNWMGDANRLNVYNTWSRLMDLKTSQNVFENGTYSWNISNTGKPRLDVWTSTSSTSNLSYVIVLTNFSDATYNAVGGFPYTGTWANLMDNSTFNVTNVNMAISIEPGGFRVFGNQPALSNSNFDMMQFIELAPNPATTSFMVNAEVKNVTLYTLTGQLVKSFENLSINQNYSIEELSKGMYIAKIEAANGLSKSVKLIKE
ncbi:alpha-amylase family glycosyl hydrolase [Flavobacterium sp. N1719]|uniref:alpha-amylase family glycosyl hydrolase n=1 Tax=Flavobacterium sp. N1719 TaxID=2885633 RepID=UPI0022215067|nr:alpha-amylase family glycosyl hydrolase [Flavobacterium sp. N1719]